MGLSTRNGFKHLPIGLGMLRAEQIFACERFGLQFGD